MTDDTPAVLYVSIDRSGLSPVPVASFHKHMGADAWIPRDAVRVKPLEWEGGTYTTTDDDGGPREGFPRRLFAWRSHPYLIILQDGDRGMYILRGKSDGIGLVVPTLEAAKAAAKADFEARIMSALAALPAPDEGEQDEGE